MSFHADTDRIIWSEGRELYWTDFQGNPDYSDDFRSAVTASAINFKTRCNPDNSLDVTISAQFLKNQSWVKPEAHTDYHLGHERLHFHITELYVRKFRDTIDEKQLTCDDYEWVEQYAEEIMESWRNAQIKYDKETKYSLDRKMQRIWEDSVFIQLYNTADLAE